ncbi:MAG TPA: glucosamine-6-phosphate deaminase [Vicinamibacterales bacterium]|nr:glucosamine-6-phosphate deaminase [Vicinamibacterales bacterium]
MMQILVLPTSGLAARAAAQFVGRTLRARPASVLGLPTGRTMIPFYREIARLHARGSCSFRRATTFNLDEFIGLRPGHPGSYRAFMHHHLIDAVDLPEASAHFPDIDGRDPGAYDDRIVRTGGMDLCVLGIGLTGHVGFNEPAAHLSARTHRVRLLPATRRANAYLFHGLARVPKYAVSMGMATILNSRTVILLATGAGKAAIVRRALAGPVTTRVPASLIQTHPNALVVLDRAAAAKFLSS